MTFLGKVEVKINPGNDLALHHGFNLHSLGSGAKVSDELINHGQSSVHVPTTHLCIQRRLMHILGSSKWELRKPFATDMTTGVIFWGKYQINYFSIGPYNLGASEKKEVVIHQLVAYFVGVGFFPEGHSLV